MLFSRGLQATYYWGSRDVRGSEIFVELEGLVFRKAVFRLSKTRNERLLPLIIKSKKPARVLLLVVQKLKESELCMCWMMGMVYQFTRVLDLSLRPKNEGMLTHVKSKELRGDSLTRLIKHRSCSHSWAECKTYKSRHGMAHVL